MLPRRLAEGFWIHVGDGHQRRAREGSTSLMAIRPSAIDREGASTTKSALCPPPPFRAIGNRLDDRIGYDPGAENARGRRSCREGLSDGGKSGSGDLR